MRVAALLTCATAVSAVAVAQLVPGLPLPIPGAAQLANPASIVNTLGQLTSMTNLVKSLLTGIPVLNTATAVAGQSLSLTSVVTQLTSLTSITNVAAPSIVGLPNKSITGTDATKVTQSFRALVVAQTSVFNSLAGQASLTKNVPVLGYPIYTALKAVQASVEQFAMVLMNAVDDASSKAIKADLTSFQSSIGRATSVFSLVPLPALPALPMA